MIDVTATDRSTCRTTVDPSPLPVPASSPDGTTLITEQQVLFSTAVAVALRPMKVGRWTVVRRSVSGAMSALFTDARPPAQRYVARRYVYLEDSVMGREMYRL